MCNSIKSEKYHGFKFDEKLKDMFETTRFVIKILVRLK